MPEFNERELVRRCRDGDQEAFRELVERYKDVVFGLIARTIPDRGRVEDLAQEAFLRVHRGLPYFRGDARLSTWIYKIAVNVCLQELGRRKVPAVSLDETDYDDRPRRQIGAPDPAISDFELRDRLDKAIARLPPQHRVLVAAHYLQGVQYEDLAAALDLPLGTVKTQLHRAKRKLRELLETDAT